MLGSKTIACVMALISTTLTSATEVYTPAVFWAKNRIFESRVNDVSILGQNKQFSTKELASSIRAVKKNERGKEDVMKIQTMFEVMYLPPELVVLFVRDSLPLENMEMLEESFLEDTVRTAASSVYFPHTKRGENDKLTTELKDADQTIAIDKVTSFVKKDKDNTELVLVTIPESVSLDEMDEMIKRSVEFFDKATGGKVYYGLTGNSAPIAPTRRLLEAAAVKNQTLVCEEGYLLSTAGKTPFCFSHYVNITPTIVSGLVMSFFFLFCVYIGLYYLDDIQTPTRYPSVGPPKGKEF